MARLLAGAMLWGLAASGLGQTPPTEYEVKAAFLYKFFKFVEWPSTEAPPKGTPLVIGVLGEDPYGAVLDESVAGKEIDGQPVQIRRLGRSAPVQELQACHILFISSSERDRLKQILDRLEGKPILTVGETLGFAQNGGMIEFYLQEDRVRLRINLSPVDKANLKISAKLLSLSTVLGKGRAAR